MTASKPGIPHPRMQTANANCVTSNPVARSGTDMHSKGQSRFAKQSYPLDNPSEAHVDVPRGRWVESAGPKLPNIPCLCRTRWRASCRLHTVAGSQRKTGPRCDADQPKNLLDGLSSGSSAHPTGDSMTVRARLPARPNRRRQSNRRVVPVPGRPRR